MGGVDMEVDGVAMDESLGRRQKVSFAPDAAVLGATGDDAEKIEV